jgi:hypothetical protein
MTRLVKLVRNPWIWLALVALILLHIYFVRELLAAELLFALGFVIAAVIFAVAYLASAAGDATLGAAETGVRRFSPLYRRAFRASGSAVPNRKPSRRPHSESAR